eukprot:scaffold8413_cov135-Isochrysis_galbana.AAC.1
MALNSRESFDQSEWGPWIETYVDHEDAVSGTVSKRRVLRTNQSGVEFMLKSPDLRVDPGYEEFLCEADWSMKKVFSDIAKVTFPPAAPPDTKAVWASLGVWHGQHERSRDVRAVP